MELTAKAVKIAADGKTESESSAHPGTPFFDQTFADQVLGDLAEEVRGWLADKYDARPPGLQTQANPDGSIAVIADNPDQGIGVQVDIKLLDSQPMPEDDLGVGPPEMESSPMGGPDLGLAPPPAQPGMGVAPSPAAQAPSPGMMQVGPPPAF